MWCCWTRGTDIALQQTRSIDEQTSTHTHSGTHTVTHTVTHTQGMLPALPRRAISEAQQVSALPHTRNWDGALAVVRAVGGEAHGDPVDRVPKGSGQVWAMGHMLTAAWGGRGGGGSAGSSVFRRRRDAAGSCGRMRRGMRMQTPGGVVAMSWRGREVVGRRGRWHLRVHGARKRSSGRRGASGHRGHKVHQQAHSIKRQPGTHRCSL